MTPLARPCNRDMAPQPTERCGIISGDARQERSALGKGILASEPFGFDNGLGEAGQGAPCPASARVLIVEHRDGTIERPPLPHSS
jgi:hypothetical protein